MYNHTITLNNGVKIPQLGLGTWFINESRWQMRRKQRIPGLRRKIIR